MGKFLQKADEAITKLLNDSAFKKAINEVSPGAGAILPYSYEVGKAYATGRAPPHPATLLTGLLAGFLPEDTAKAWATWFLGNQIHGYMPPPPRPSIENPPINANAWIHAIGEAIVSVEIDDTKQQLKEMVASSDNQKKQDILSAIEKVYNSIIEATPTPTQMLLNGEIENTPSKPKKKYAVSKIVRYKCPRRRLTKSVNHNR
jgi:hypothetical protein